MFSYPGSILISTNYSIVFDSCKTHVSYIFNFILILIVLDALHFVYRSSALKY